MIDHQAGAINHRALGIQPVGRIGGGGDAARLLANRLELRPGRQTAGVPRGLQPFLNAQTAGADHGQSHPVRRAQPLGRVGQLRPRLLKPAPVLGTDVKGREAGGGGERGIGNGKATDLVLRPGAWAPSIDVLPAEIPHPQPNLRPAGRNRSPDLDSVGGTPCLVERFPRRSPRDPRLSHPTVADQQRFDVESRLRSRRDVREARTRTAEAVVMKSGGKHAVRDAGDGGFKEDRLPERRKIEDGFGKGGRFAP